MVAEQSIAGERFGMKRRLRRMFEGWAPLMLLGSVAGTLLFWP